MAEKERTDVLERLVAAHGSFYDIRRDCPFEGRIFPAIAEFHTYGEQYVLVKRAKLWEVNSHDFMFFESLEALDEELLRAEIEFMTTKGLRKVDAGPNHMSSALSLVIIADECTDEALRIAKKTRFRKNHRLGLRGWTDLRLAVVDLSRNTVTTNAAGTKLTSVLEGNLALVK